MRQGAANGVLAAFAVLAATGPAAAGGPTTYDIAPLLREPYPLTPPGSSGMAATQPALRDDADSPAEPALSRFAAARDRWFVHASVGLAIPRTADARGTIDTRIDFNNGGTLAGSGGYVWRNGFRVEGQLWYQTFAVNDVEVKNPGAVPGLSQSTSRDGGGDNRVLLLTANAAYDFETDGAWSPYVLGGVGAARFKYADVSNAAGVRIIDDSAWVMAFQFGAGIAYLFSDHWSADASYRYVFTLKPTLDDAAGNQLDTEFATHNFVFGVRYAF